MRTMHSTFIGTIKLEDGKERTVPLGFPTIVLQPGLNHTEASPKMDFTPKRLLIPREQCDDLIVEDVFVNDVSLKETEQYKFPLPARLFAENGSGFDLPWDGIRFSKGDKVKLIVKST